MPSFDILAARKAGYTDQEISAFLQQRGIQQSTQRLKDIVGKGPEALRQKITAPSEYSGMQSSPEEDAQTAGLSATGLSAVMNPVATARGVAGGMVGAWGGGHAGHYLGGVPGRMMNNPSLEKQGAGLGEAVGVVGGGLAGSIMGAKGMPLKAKVAGLPVEVGGAPPAEVPAGHVLSLSQAAQKGGMASAAGGSPAWQSQAFTPEAQTLLQRIEAMSPEERSRYFIQGAVQRMKNPSWQGSDLVDPSTFAKGYKPR